MPVLNATAYLDNLHNRITQAHLDKPLINPDYLEERIQVNQSIDDALEQLSKITQRTDSYELKMAKLRLQEGQLILNKHFRKG